MKISLFGTTELTKVHEKTKQKLKLVFTNRVHYNANRNNPVIRYKHLKKIITLGIIINF